MGREQKNGEGARMLKMVIVGTPVEAYRSFASLQKVAEWMEWIGYVSNEDKPFWRTETGEKIPIPVPTAKSIQPFLQLEPDVIVDFSDGKLLKEQFNRSKPLIFSGNNLEIWRTIVQSLVSMSTGGQTTSPNNVKELEQLTQQVHDLEGMKSFFQAIINSFDDAISVVDADGKGFLINPAYTRLTGLTAEQVIGKPAEVDIAEGESMHRQVLQTQEPVRGVQLKVGPNRKEVVVNVAPILVGAQCKGSVGIIHDRSELEKLSQDLMRAKSIIRRLEAKYLFEDIIGESEEMKFAIQQAKQAATTRATVLLRGESGTGKELFAHAIHNASQRKLGPFVRVNCAALVGSLLESELFGYDEGAFTGAKRGGKKGLFEEASGGTIFLDEIGEMDLSTQAKLLRVLQEKEVVRVGGTKVISVDVRVIAATHVPLEQAIQERRFREDLYYRLNVFPIHIAPLRLRKEDLLKLTEYLIHKLNREYGRNVTGLSEEVKSLLRCYDFPGNVRELENLLGRAMIQMKFSDQVMEKEHFPMLIQPDLMEVKQKGHIASLKEQLEMAEKEILHRTMAEFGNQKVQVAKHLQISIRSLYYKLEKYGMYLQ